VCQHSHNKGRFEARRSGALKAHYDDLFFVDDRVTVPQSLLSEIIRAEERIIMPNVIESEYPNFMSRFLYLIRRKVYGKNRWGTSFSPYYIDNSNFEKSPKGTGSLCLPKDLFLESCSRLADTTVGSTKNISDDTKLLRYMIESGARIYRPSSIIVNYQPRQKLGQELYHVYQRGPKFVDYYFRRGSRFQPYLLVSLALLFLGVLGVLAWRWEFLEVILALSILGIVALAIILKERLSDLWVVCVALPVAIILFGLGILKGLGSKIYSRIA
jgi:hypothetical protein